MLPLNNSDGDRWAGVRMATEKMIGLPPIEVYQIGDAYFILDGHHRASVARELGSTHIQAYVRQVRTLIPVSPTDRIEDIILKSEYTDFVKKTRLDVIRPEANLQVTVPGQYNILYDHIVTHRYFQGINEKREISFDEAVADWYDQVYEPVARMICRLNILKDFPERSETDLYLWIMDHRSSLEAELGWKVNPQTAVKDLSNQFGPKIQRAFQGFFQHFFFAIAPEEIIPSTPPGDWRRQRKMVDDDQRLFQNIMVALPGDSAGWEALDLAVNIAAREDAMIGGLHVVQAGDVSEQSDLQAMVQEFDRRIAEHQIEGKLVIETGEITKSLFDRSSWADLVILRMLYPPPFRILNKLRSGLRTLIRISRVPLLVFPPGGNTDIKCLLLAYGGGPRADEALFVATYLASKWGLQLSVVTVDRGRPGDDRLAKRARTYLTEHHVEQANFIHKKGDPARITLQAADATHCDLIIMGGYDSGPLSELIFGSTVDWVLWATHKPVLICQ